VQLAFDPTQMQMLHAQIRTGHTLMLAYDPNVIFTGLPIASTIDTSSVTSMLFCWIYSNPSFNNFGRITCIHCTEGDTSANLCDHCDSVTHTSLTPIQRKSRLLLTSRSKDACSIDHFYHASPKRGALAASEHPKAWSAQACAQQACPRPPL
jgi:hypothetical protein